MDKENIVLTPIIVGLDVMDSKVKTHRNSFLTPILNTESLDIFIIRSSILDALTKNIGQFKGTLLDVGCGEMPYKSLLISPLSKVERYVGLDLGNNALYTKSVPDIFWDGETIPLPDISVECAIATEVLEHCPKPENVMKEIYRVLRPEGIFFFTVPFIWPLHDVPYDQYRYTPYSLERLLSNSGFEQIDIKAMGGWDASLAQMIGLWVNRRPLPYLSRKIYQAISLPIIRALVRSDMIPDNYAGRMVTGFSGIARKTL
jgi:SAM-dependent methyltransferase